MNKHISKAMSDALELIIKHGDTPTKAAIATGIQRQSIYRNAQYKAFKKEKYAKNK